jgi:hypothetical protein
MAASIASGGAAEKPKCSGAGRSLDQGHAPLLVKSPLVKVRTPQET